MCVCVCRLYGTKCAGCKTGLCPEDMVRRAMDKVYHLACFSCSLCRKELQTGEQLFLVQVHTHLGPVPSSLVEETRIHWRLDI